jgi:hypothetical protein
MSFKIQKHIQTKIKVFLIFLFILTSINYFYQARYVTKLYTLNIILKDNYSIFTHNAYMDFNKWIKTEAQDYKHNQFIKDQNRCKNNELGLENTYTECILKILDEKKIYNHKLDQKINDLLSKKFDKSSLIFHETQENNLRELIQDIMLYERSSNEFLSKIQKKCADFKLQNRGKYIIVKCTTTEAKKMQKQIPIYISQLWGSLIGKQTSNNLIQVITSKSSYKNNRLKNIILFDAILIFCFVSYITLLTNRKKITY